MRNAGRFRRTEVAWRTMMPGARADKFKIITGGAVGGLIAAMVMWILTEHFHLNQPPELSALVANIIIPIGGVIGSKI
jgi:putative effector of murein hydrolase